MTTSGFVRSPRSDLVVAGAIFLAAVTLFSPLGSSALVRILATLVLIGCAVACISWLRSSRSDIGQAALQAERIASGTGRPSPQLDSPVQATSLLRESLDAVADHHLLLNGFAHKTRSRQVPQPESDRLRHTPLSTVARLFGERVAEADHALVDNSRVLRAVLETSADPVVIVNDEGNVELANRAAHVELDGTEANIATFLPEWQDLSAEGVEIDRPDGDRIVTIHAEGRQVLTEGGPRHVLAWRATNVVGISDEEATHDPLTGLLNRSGLKASLKPFFDKGEGLAAIHMDLEGFQAINHHHGPAEGDAFLRQIARRIIADAPENAVAARVNGDEFVVLANATWDRAKNLVERLTEHCGTSIPLLDGGKASVSVRVGWATLEVHEAAAGESMVSTVLDQAAAALHDAKATGTRVAEYDPRLAARTLAERQTEIELRAAIAEGQFMLFGQPVLDVSSGQTVSTELFLRWLRPDGRIISPGEFLPIAARCNLLDQIDRWVVDAAFAQALNATDDMPFSINLSSQFLATPGMVEHIIDLVRSSDLKHGRLNVEIADSTPADLEQLMATTHRLTTHGVGITLDDFGTGYSSLANLARMALDTIKIDRSLVELVHEDDGHEVVRAILRYAHQQGLRVIAEGVESQEEASLLEAMGCVFQQGYTHRRPAALSEILNPTPPEVGAFDLNMAATNTN